MDETEIPYWIPGKAEEVQFSLQTSRIPPIDKEILGRTN